jgi:restriction endonuclease S subunit
VNGEINWFTIDDIKKQGREIFNTQQSITQKALNESSLKIIPVDSILLCCTASVGEYAISKIPLTTNQQFNALVIKKSYKNKLLPQYLFYISSKFKETLEIIGGSTSFSYVAVKTLKTLKIPIPTLFEQENLIKELDSYSDIIKGNKLSLISYHPNFLFNEEWELVELKDVCKYSGGTQPPKSTFVYEPKDGYIRLLQIRDYKSNDNAVYIPVSEKHKTCTEKDIMIGRYGPPVFQILRGKRGAYNVALIKCIPDKKRLTEDWLYYFLNSEQIQNHIIGLSERSRQAGVSPSDLDKLKIPLPSIEAQKEIVAKIKEEEQLIAANKKLVEIFEEKISNRVNQIWGV